MTSSQEQDAGAKAGDDDDDNNSVMSEQSIDILMESSSQPPTSLLPPNSPVPDDSRNLFPQTKTTTTTTTGAKPGTGRQVVQPREGRKPIKKATTVSTSKSMSPMRPRAMASRVFSTGARRSPARNKMPLRLPSKSDRRGKMRVAGEYLSDRSLQSSSLGEAFKKNLDDDSDPDITPFGDALKDDDNDRAVLRTPPKRTYSSSRLQIVDIIEATGSGDSTSAGGGTSASTIPRRTQTMPEGDGEKIAADIKAKAAKGTGNFTKRVTDKVVKRAASMTNPLLRPSLSFDSADSTNTNNSNKKNKKKKKDSEALKKFRNSLEPKGRSLSPLPMMRSSTAPNRAAAAPAGGRSLSPARVTRAKTDGTTTAAAQRQRPKPAMTRAGSIKKLAGSFLSPKSDKKEVDLPSKRGSYNQLGSKFANKFSKSMTSIETPFFNNNGGNKNDRWTPHTPQDLPPSDDDAPASWSFRRSLQAKEGPEEQQGKSSRGSSKKKKSKDKEAKEKKKEKKKLKKKKSIDRSISPTTLRRMSSSFSKFEDMKFDITGEQNKLKAKDKARDEIKAIKERKAAKKKDKNRSAKRVNSSKSSSKRDHAAPMRHVRRIHTNPDNLLSVKLGGGGGSSADNINNRRESMMKRASSGSSLTNYLRNSSRSLSGSNMANYARSSLRGLTGTNMANYIKNSSRSLTDKAKKSDRGSLTGTNMANYIKNSSRSLTDKVKKSVISTKKTNENDKKKEETTTTRTTAAPAAADTTPAGGLLSVVEQYKLALSAANEGSTEINFDAAFKEKSENLIKVILSSQSESENSKAASEQEQEQDDDFLVEAMRMASPTPYLCPICDHIMKDPVTTAVGSTYERKAIQWWLTKSDIDPVTQRRMPEKVLTPNNELKATIDNWKDEFKTKLSPPKTTEDSVSGVAKDSTMKEADGVAVVASAVVQDEAQPAISTGQKKVESKPKRKKEKISYQPAAKREFSPIKDLVIEDIEIEDVQVDEEWRPSVAPPPPPPPPVVVTDPDEIGMPEEIEANAVKPEGRIEKISYQISPAAKREFSPIKDLVIEDVEIEDIQIDEEWRPSVAPPPPPPPPVVVTDPDEIGMPEEEIEANALKPESRIEKISFQMSPAAKREFSPIKDPVIKDIEIEDIEIEDIQMDDDWRPSIAPPPPPPAPVVVTDPDEIGEPEESGDPMDSEIDQMLESMRRSSEVGIMDNTAGVQGTGSSLLGPGGLDGPSEHSLPGYNWTAATAATSALGGTPGQLDGPSEHSQPGYNWTAATTATSALGGTPGQLDGPSEHSQPGYNWTASTTATSALGGTPGQLNGPSEHSQPGYNWNASTAATSALDGTSSQTTDKAPTYDWKAASPKQNAKEKVNTAGLAGTGFWTDLTAGNSPNSKDSAGKNSPKSKSRSPSPKSKSKSRSPSPKSKSKSPTVTKKKNTAKLHQSASALMDIMAWGSDSDSDDDSSSVSSSEESSVAHKPQQKLSTPSTPPKPRRKSMFDDSDSDSDDDYSSELSDSNEQSARDSTGSMGSLGVEDLGSKSLLGSSSDEESEDDDIGYGSLPTFAGKGDGSGNLHSSNKNRRRTLKPFQPFHSSMSALDYVQFTPTNFVQQREERFDDYYELGQLLGEGEFGEVFIGYQKQGSGSLGEERAIKIIDKHRMCSGDYEQVINEFNLLKGLTHPNLLTLYGFYEDSSNCYIVTDLCKGGELWDELDARGNFEEAEAAVFMTNLLSAVKFLQSHKIVHRDINLENILLEENKELDHMKIIDFGLATKYEDGVKLTELVGKVHYVAPEVLEMSYEGSKYDVWSCGVVAFILLSGYAPFEADNDILVMEQVTLGLRDANFNDPAWDDISDEAKDFVRHLMTYEEDSRPTAEQALKHAWIQNSIQETRESFIKAYGETSISCFENMQDFASDVSDVSLLKLKQAVYVFIASQLLLKEEREEIDRVFRGMDSDCDGKLSKPDIKFGYKRFFNKELSDKETDQMFDRINTSRTGYIDYTEFVIAAMQKSKILDTEKLRAAFSSFDRGDKGFISANDLKLALSGVIALPVDNDDGLDADKIIQEMIMQVDTEGDGKISYQNFEDMMMAEEIEGGSKDMEVDENPVDDADALPPPPEFSRTSSLDYNFATASFMGNAKQASAIAAQVAAIMEE